MGNLAIWETLLSGENSARKTAHKMPMGTLTSMPIPTMTTVPKMALPNPPPISKAVGGNSVKSCQESLWLPRIISMISTENSGKQAKIAIIQVPKLRMPLIRDRRSQSDRRLTIKKR
jgi:hypothetical protein